MGKSKDPAFLFYSSDFMMGCMFMSMEQRGQYISLLCALHQHGRLTLPEIETILHGKCPDIILGKLKVDNGEYYSERLESEMTKRRVFAESRRNSLKIDNGDMVHLYIVFDPSTGLYKIGSSKYPELRLKEAQKFKKEATLFWVSEILVERINEKHLHDEFSEKRKRYDWFDLTTKDLETIRTRFSNNNRTDSRTENENENENRIEDKDFKYHLKEAEKKLDDLDDRLTSALDEIYLDEQRMKWQHVNFDFEVNSFREKVRGSPEHYARHDSGGIRLAFQSQLRNAKHKGNGISKTGREQAVNARREGFAKRHSSDAGN